MKEITKTCKRCGKMLPETEFHVDRNGYRSPLCLDCYKARHKEYNEKRKSLTTPTSGNPDLAKFTPRDLMVELRARGYRGTLTYLQEINIEKL